MKSVEDFYRDEQGDESLKKEFITAFKEGQIESFLTSHDCDASAALNATAQPCTWVWKYKEIGIDGLTDRREKSKSEAA